MSLRSAVRSAADAALVGIAPLFRRFGTLRILAYHDVVDRARFGRQLDHLRAHYTPVGAAEVLAALKGGPLPSRAVWITFDDGDPTVIENGLRELMARDLTATLFVCPSVVDTQAGLWFQVARRVLPSEVDVVALKHQPPEVRQELLERHATTCVQQCTRDDLQRWVDAGCTLGNHTWSHPLLDQEPIERIAREIDRAQSWLDQEFPGQPRIFAYPNGNRTDHAEQVLQQEDFELALLFDHRLTSLDNPYRLSRIRVNASDSLARFSASVSGAHPTWNRIRRRLARSA